MALGVRRYVMTRGCYLALAEIYGRKSYLASRILLDRSYDIHVGS